MTIWNIQCCITVRLLFRRKKVNNGLAGDDSAFFVSSLEKHCKPPLAPRVDKMHCHPQQSQYLHKTITDQPEYSEIAISYVIEAYVISYVLMLWQSHKHTHQ